VTGYGDRLMAIYAAVAVAASSATCDAAQGDALLDAFLAPERLCLLRG
jgi:hypothetical protein